MFVFVVPLKSRNCCSDWTVASQLCNRSIRSMLAGSASKVILVCNEPPEGLPSNDRLIVKPIVSRMPRTHYEMMEDKSLQA